MERPKHNLRERGMSSEEEELTPRSVVEREACSIKKQRGASIYNSVQKCTFECHFPKSNEFLAFLNWKRGKKETKHKGMVKGVYVSVYRAFGFLDMGRSERSK
jgi:hypothetical protein